MEVGAAITSEDGEVFSPPRLSKDFYARHLAAAPDFDAAYTASQDYFVRRALSATRANLVHLQPKVLHAADGGVTACSHAGSKALRPSSAGSHTIALRCSSCA